MGNGSYINVNKYRYKNEDSAAKIVELIGKDNIINVSNCISRIRIKVKDNSKLNRSYFMKLEYVDLVKIKKNTIHIISKTNPENTTI